MKNFNSKIIDINEFQISKLEEYLEDWQYDGFDEYQNKVTISDMIIFNENKDCYCLNISVNSEEINIIIPIIITKSLNFSNNTYRINQKIIQDINVIRLSFFGAGNEEYIMNTTAEELKSSLIDTKIDYETIEYYNVKDYFIKFGINGVHNEVRSNSQGKPYVTFIYKDNNFTNIFFSQELSSNYTKGQKIIKGFFEDLNITILKSNNISRILICENPKKKETAEKSNFISKEERYENDDYYDSNNWLIDAAGTNDPETMNDVYWNLD